MWPVIGVRRRHRNCYRRIEWAGNAHAVEIPPLGVTGTPKGEELRSEPLSDDVLLESPTDAVPLNESRDERLKREQAAAPKPAVVGFDAELSVEDPASRSAYGTTYKNVDGSWTTVIDDTKHRSGYLASAR